jgi:hypothetical protein
VDELEMVPGRPEVLIASGLELEELGLARAIAEAITL